MDIKAVAYAVARIEPDSLEYPVQTAWVNLCGKGVFNEDTYYIASNEPRNSQVPDICVVEIRFFAGGEAGIDVLIIECKRPRDNPTEVDFNELANAQLGDQLTEAMQGSHLYGAVAIGKMVKFYKMIAEPESGQKIANAVSSILQIDTQAVEVERCLLQIKRDQPMF